MTRPDVDPRADDLPALPRRNRRADQRGNVGLVRIRLHAPRLPGGDESGAKPHHVRLVEADNVPENRNCGTSHNALSLHRMLVIRVKCTDYDFHL